MAAIKLPRDTPELAVERQQALESATLQAAKVPLEVAEKAVEVLELAARVVSTGNLNAISDGASGAALAWAALTGAGYNVRINIASLQDALAGQALLADLRLLEGRAAEIEQEIRSQVEQRGGISLE
jgi:formiminotetrahydrofolate cyclodeaminase